MLRRRFFYSIEGFHPPTEDYRLGGFGFTVYLDRELAKRSLQKRLEENFSIRKIGRDIIKSYGFSIKDYFEPYFFARDEKNNLNCLVRAFHVPGDACDLGIDWQEIKELKEEDGEFTKHWVEYSSHNVDSLQQASALLSLFTHWANTMAVLLNLTLIK